MSIDAYYDQGESEGAGNLQVVIDNTNPKYQVFVDLGSVTAPTEQFSFKYN